MISTSPKHQLPSLLKQGDRYLTTKLASLAKQVSKAPTHPHQGVNLSYRLQQQVHCRGMSGIARSNMSGRERGAYIDPDLVVPRSKEGPLSGLCFAAKDLFDVAGHVTGFGHPTWRATHAPAREHAAAVQLLLDAGATLQGKAHMDELAYSLNGENFHYGTPENPAAPGHVPGGSSSGSAVACASGDVDFALGSDTGGSVRIPASFCGLYGLRPTHGRITTVGAQPLAASFCTVGYFTRNSTLLQEVGSVLLNKETRANVQLSRWLVPRDAWALADPATSMAIYRQLSDHPATGEVLGKPFEFDMCVVGGDRNKDASAAPSGTYAEIQRMGVGQLVDWFDVFRIHQAGEIWETHGPWISEHMPVLGPGTKERIQMASGITPEERAAAAKKRAAIRAHMHALLGSDGILTIPSAPGVAPVCNCPSEQLDAWRRRMINLLCIAGLAGLPQVSIPAAEVDGLPVGLSLIGPAGSDEALLELAGKLARGLELPE